MALENAWTAKLPTKAHKDANPRLMNTTEAAILAVSHGRSPSKIKIIRPLPVEFLLLQLGL